MRLSTFLIIGQLLFSLLSYAQSPTPVAANGQLKLVGRQLSNQSGKAIQLRGMSSHGLQYFPNCFNASSIQTLAKDWGIDVFRSAMYVDEGGYESDKAKYRAFVDNLVDWTGQNGVYNIIDWHILNPGNPNVHLDDAKEFFQIEAQKHAGKKHVIYEICNEPHDVSWTDIKSYAIQIIRIIRMYDKEAIIIVGTPNYSGTPSDAGNDPITGADAYNVMYTFHFYAGSHYTEDYIDGVLKTVPLFVSEWGTSNYSGNGGNDYNNSQKWLDLLAGGNSSGIKVSWCNWNFSDNSETSAALNQGSCNSGAWNNTSESGTWVKAHILNPADDFGPATPSVSITGPATSTTVAIGSNVVITASVSNTTATSVDFYNGSQRIGGGTTAPYSATITNIQSGTYAITAQANFSSGSPLTSSPVQITATTAPNQPPTVTLTAPANNSSYTAPATLTLTATANDPDGSVALVEFYNGTMKIGQSTTAPYQFIWSNVGANTYTLSAKATDNKGATGNSATATVYVGSPGSSTDDVIGPTCVVANDVKVYSVNANDLPSATSFSWWCTGSTQSITQNGSQATINFGPSFTGGQVCVGINYSAAPWYKQFCKNVTVCTGTTTTPPATNQAPTVALTAPANNATFTAPATITLTATASDADGSVAKVEFYNGSAKLGESSTAPYQYVWTNVSANSYTLTAKATDNQGAITTSSPVTIQVKSAAVNQPPTVALTSPVNNATYTAPATIGLTVTASDADGSVAKVEFYNGTAKLGESTNSPYQYAWTNVAAGSYTVTAKATDNQGAMTTSAAITIQVKTATSTSTADILGPDCVRANDVIVFEVNSRNLTNATGFSWWCNGSTQSITPGPAGKATYNFGPYYTGGQVCVGINYNGAPYYQQFCKSVSLCPSGARTVVSDVADGPVFPNPSHDQFTFKAERDIQSMSVVDQVGREHLKLGTAKAGQTVTFGEQLPTGTYLFHIRYEGQPRRTVKLLKVSN